MIVAAVRDAIVALPGVTVDLATWDFGDGVRRPAVFTREPAPAECENPVCTVTLAGGDNYGTRDQRGGEIDVEVKVWGDKLGSEKRLRGLAMALWRGLDRAALTIEGYNHGGTQAYAPRGLTDAEGFPGYVMLVRVRALEEV